MMSLCVDYFVNKLGAAGVCTYSLVVKRGAAFIPTFWSLMIDDTDRAFFLLNTIPNNRLDTGKEGRPQPYVHLRLLKDGDMDLPPVKTCVVGLDRVTWGDRLFNMKTTPGRSTYLLQSESKIVGYLTITLADGGVFYIDEVAVDEKHQGQNGKGYGPILMRFADSLARHNDCRTVRLYAIYDRIQFYEGHGYKVVQSVAPIPLDTNTYQLMEAPDSLSPAAHHAGVVLTAEFFSFGTTTSRRPRSACRPLAAAQAAIEEKRKAAKPKAKKK